MRRVVCVAIALMVCTVKVHAQYPAEVEQYAASGEYLKALATFDSMPKRISTVDSRIAAGKSAWALSLPVRAQKEFEEALKDSTLSDSRKAELYSYRSILDLQEKNFELAVHYANTGLSLCKNNCPSRSMTLLSQAQAMVSLGKYGEAEGMFLDAFEGAPLDQETEISFQLAHCRLKLGKLDDAQADFERVPVGHERTPDAIRGLATIALEKKEWGNAGFWLTKGRKEYPDAFLDSWVDYALTEVAVHEKDIGKVREVRTAAAKRYAPSDPWFTLLSASAESYEWNSRGMK